MQLVLPGMKPSPASPCLVFPITNCMRPALTLRVTWQPDLREHRVGTPGDDRRPGRSILIAFP